MFKFDEVEFERYLLANGIDIKALTIFNALTVFGRFLESKEIPTSNSFDCDGKFSDDKCKF